MSRIVGQSEPDILWPQDPLEVGAPSVVQGRLFFLHLNGLDLPYWRGRCYAEIVEPYRLGSIFHRVFLHPEQLSLPDGFQGALRQVTRRHKGGVLICTAAEIQRAAATGQGPQGPYLTVTSEPWVGPLGGEVGLGKPTGAHAGPLAGHKVLVVHRDYRPGPTVHISRRPAVIGTVVDADT